MNLKEYFFDLFNMFIEKKVDEEKISILLKKILPLNTGLELIRLGEENDGGYLIPNDLNNIELCFSAGVGELTKFEKDLKQKYNINSILADFNDINENILPESSKFIKKKISFELGKDNLNLNEFISFEKDIILKIDIEGDEYLNLINFDEKKFDNVRILIIELHDLRNLRSNFFYQMFEKFLNKLCMHFYICHLHPNNSSKIKKIGKYLIPDMIELTLINKKRIKKKINNYSLIPHPLDQKTDPNQKEIFVFDNWNN